MKSVIEVAIEKSETEIEDGQQWIEVVPLGKIKGFDGRQFYIRDAAKFIANSNIAVKQIPVDYEHQTELSRVNGKPAPAAGWIDQLEVRGNSIWAHVNWNTNAEQMIIEKEYRYISPVLSISPNTGEAVQLASVALTNTPNLSLKALNKEADQSMILNTEDDGVQSHLKRALGLPEATRSEQLVNHIIAMRQQIDNSVPVDIAANMMEDHNSYRKSVMNQQAELSVSDAIKSGILTPSLKNWGLQLYKENQRAFELFIENAPPHPFMEDHSEYFSEDRLDNIKSNSTSSEADDVCAQLGLDIGSIK